MNTRRTEAVFDGIFAAVVLAGIAALLIIGALNAHAVEWESRVFGTQSVVPVFSYDDASDGTFALAGASASDSTGYYDGMFGYKGLNGIASGDSVAFRIKTQAGYDELHMAVVDIDTVSTAGPFNISISAPASQYIKFVFEAITDNGASTSVGNVYLSRYRDSN